jgi:hypothetical protein
VTVPTLLVDDDDADVGSDADDTGSGGGPAATSGPLGRLLWALPLVVAVAVPLVLFTIRALHAPLNFDGGMNMQVAERLADGHGYTRFYDELQIYPHEVQTNGPFIYVAAIALKVLGVNQLALQFANLTFVAAFAAVVFFLLREHKVLRVVGPWIVLLTAPVVSLYGLGGLGEIPVTAFMLASILALAQAVRVPERAPWWVAGAALAYGAALATKTFSTGAAPALAAGGVCVLVAASTRRRRLQILGAGAAVALLPLIREGHKVLATGGLSGYRSWWSAERAGISAQSGLGGGRDAGPAERFLDHMHILSGHLDTPAELLIPILFVPLVWAAAVLVWRWRTQGLQRTLADPGSALLLMVAVLAGTYIGWWLFLVPEAKTWIRRIYPGMLALQLLYLLMVPWLVQVGRSALARVRGGGAAPAPAGSDDGDHGRHGDNGDVPVPEPVGASPLLRWAPVVGLAATVVVLAVTALPYTVRKIDRNTRDLLEGQELWLHDNEAAADFVEDHPDVRFYGDEWWSAPVISAMSERGFHNVGDADFCSLDPEHDMLVWDLDARQIRSPEPWTRNGRLAYEEVAVFGGHVTIYGVSPGPAEDCD